MSQLGIYSSGEFRAPRLLSAPPHLRHPARLSTSPPSTHFVYVNSASKVNFVTNLKATCFHYEKQEKYKQKNKKKKKQKNPTIFKKPIKKRKSSTNKLVHFLSFVSFQFDENLCIFFCIFATSPFIHCGFHIAFALKNTFTRELCLLFSTLP